MQETRPPITISLRDPDGLDSDDTDEVAKAALEDLYHAAIALDAPARRVEVQVLNAAMDHALNAGQAAGIEVGEAAGRSPEVEHARRARAFIVQAARHLAAASEALLEQ